MSPYWRGAGAPYFAVMGVHAGGRMMSEWHRSVAGELALPRLYDLDEVVAVSAMTRSAMPATT